MSFKVWSQLNREAGEELTPNFGFRPWNLLSEEDKYKIWQYLEFNFFNKNIQKNYNNEWSDEEDGTYYEFQGESEERKFKRKRILLSILAMNHNHKAKSYAKQYLENPTFNHACSDFYRIFMKESENVVLELLSMYAKFTISERKEEIIFKRDEESDKDYQERLEKWRWIPFDEFTERLNDVFVDFGLNVFLTRQGFVPRQEPKISEQIYEPVLKNLSNPRWKEVSRLIADVFNDYRKNTEAGYSSCITNTVSAIQAFLQILVYGKTGKGEISELTIRAQKDNLIPNDFFTQTIFKNIESIFARERQETGLAHPKKEYANDKNALMVLNLAMVFIQHSLKI